MIDYIQQGDCLELMKNIPDKSIDMILCDLPYGTTACAWDTIIPFEPLWEQYERIIKDNGAIVLTASQPFTTDLINSNRRLFRYELIWDKGRGNEPWLCNIRPMKSHENICIFYKSKVQYNPQMIPLDKPDKRGACKVSFGEHAKYRSQLPKREYTHRYPVSIIKATGARRGKHPTEKPVELFEYLIKTYTNEGETVLDNCMGSGTTAVACINTNRHYIGYELDEKYFEVAQKRIEEARARFAGRLWRC
jgi:site-specific DNA-methyltransferase (adenine-specific)